MKLGRLNFKNPIGSEIGLINNEPIPVSSVGSRSPHILYLLPRKTRAVPYVAIDYVSDGDVEIHFGLWFHTTTVNTLIDAGGYEERCSNPEPKLQRLIELIHNGLLPVAKTFQLPQEPSLDLLQLYLSDREIFYKLVAKRKPPKSLIQKAYLVFQWDDWKKAGLSFKERIAEMNQRGLGEGLNEKLMAKWSEREGMH